MMIRSIGAAAPRIDPSARLAENAVIAGDVVLGADVTVWYGAVLRGDSAGIRIGRGSNVQDNVTIHCSPGVPAVIGESAVIGHGAILHSCRVENDCLVGMGAILLDGCVIGEGSVIGAGALVPPGKVIPPRSLVVGVPGKVIREISEEEVLATRENAAQYVKEGQEQLLPPEGVKKVAEPLF